MTTAAFWSCYRISTCGFAVSARKLEGYLTRQRMENDRRVVLVTPTKSGWETAEKCREKNLRQFSKLLSWLGEDDSSELLRILKRISLYYEEER